MTITINELKKLLAEGPTTFRFKKMDGSMRKMTATINPEWFTITGKLEQMSDDALTVFDLEKEEWRRVSAYTQIEI